MKRQVLIVSFLIGCGFVWADFRSTSPIVLGNYNSFSQDYTVQPLRTNDKHASEAHRLQWGNGGDIQVLLLSDDMTRTTGSPQGHTARSSQPSVQEHAEALVVPQIAATGSNIGSRYSSAITAVGSDWGSPARRYFPNPNNEPDPNDPVPVGNALWMLLFLPLLLYRRFRRQTTLLS